MSCTTSQHSLELKPKSYKKKGRDTTMSDILCGGFKENVRESQHFENTTQTLHECKASMKRMPEHSDNRASPIDFKGKIASMAEESSLAVTLHTWQ